MTGILRNGLIAILIFSSNYNVFGQADSIDRFIRNQKQQRRIPALQLAIVRHGKIIKTGNWWWYRSGGEISGEWVLAANGIANAKC